MIKQIDDLNNTQEKDDEILALGACALKAYNDELAYRMSVKADKGELCNEQDEGLWVSPTSSHFPAYHSSFVWAEGVSKSMRDAATSCMEELKAKIEQQRHSDGNEKRQDGEEEVTLGTLDQQYSQDVDGPMSWRNLVYMMHFYFVTSLPGGRMTWLQSCSPA
jgi:hypothetical protein